jgi:hypothetical protein
MAPNIPLGTPYPDTFQSVCVPQDEVSQLYKTGKLYRATVNDLGDKFAYFWNSTGGSSPGREADHSPPSVTEAKKGGHVHSPHASWRSN